MKNILILGPMYSGKSTRMIEEIEKNIRAGKKCLIVRHNIDTRTPIGSLQTHGGIVFNKCDVIATGTISDISDHVKNNNIRIIAIDEGQFFNSDDIINFMNICRDIKIVEKIYISGLNGDFMHRPFKTISDIIPLCDIISLKAVCVCGKKANFTKRLINNKSQILVGGDDMYVATCFDCHTLSLDSHTLSLDSHNSL